MIVSYVRFIKSHIILIFAVAAIAVLEYLYAQSLWSQSTLHYLRLALWLLVGFATIFKQRPFNSTFRDIITILTPLLAIGIILLLIVNPYFADTLATEDSLIENLSAFLLLLGAFMLLLMSILVVSKKGKSLLVMAAIFLAIVFFVIGMEEISWMQRSFGIATPESLATINSQKELNLHNIYTGISEKLYYLGGFLLLTLLPFFRESLAALLKKFKSLKHVAILLPGQWLVIPFSVASGFVTFYTFKSPVYVFIYVFTILIMIAVASSYKKKDKKFTYDPVQQIALPIALVSLAVSLAVLPYMAYTDARAWVGSEYREFFIALGIAAYSIDRLLDYHASVRK